MAKGDFIKNVRFSQDEKKTMEKALIRKQSLTGKPITLQQFIVDGMMDYSEYILSDGREKGGA